MTFALGLAIGVFCGAAAVVLVLLGAVALDVAEVGE